MSDPQIKSRLAALLDGLTADELRILRAMINGKLGKRAITYEQQTKMQDARKKPKTSLHK